MNMSAIAILTVLGVFTAELSEAKEVLPAETACVAVPIVVLHPSYKELEVQARQYKDSTSFRIYVMDGVILGKGESTPRWQSSLPESRNKSTFGLSIKQEF